jgi:hypothetical protein
LAEVLEEVTLALVEHLVVLVVEEVPTILVFHQLAPPELRGRDLQVETPLEVDPGHSPQALVVVELVPRVATRAMPLGEPAMEVREHHHRFWALLISLAVVEEVAHIRADLRPRQETVVPVVVVVEPPMSWVEQLDWVVVAH